MVICFSYFLYIQAKFTGRFKIFANLQLSFFGIARKEIRQVCSDFHTSGAARQSPWDKEYMEPL